MSNAALHEEWAILRQYSKYEQAVPEKKYDVMASIFTEDADLANRLGKGKGRADIEGRFKDRFENWATTKIFAVNHLIDVDGDKAKSSVDYLVLEVDPDAPAGLSVKQMGRYYDDWRNEDGTWLICNRYASEPS